MSCKIYRKEIEEADRGALLSVATSEHIRRCPECRMFEDRQAKLRRLVRELEAVSAPADFEFLLRARIASEKSPSSGGLFASRRFASSAVSIVLAACFVLSVAVLLRRTTSNTAPPPPAADTVQKPAPPTHAASTSPSPPLSPQTRHARASDSSLRETAVTEVSVHSSAGEMVPGRSRRKFDASAHRTAGAGANANKIISGHRAARAVKAGLHLTVPLYSAKRPVRVVLRDEHGTAHRVALEPVSFGAQMLVEQLSISQRDTVQVEEGVW